MEQKIKFEHKCRVANNSIDCKTARIFAIVQQTVRYSNERSGASVTIKSETGERVFRGRASLAQFAFSASRLARNDLEKKTRLFCSLTTHVAREKIAFTYTSVTFVVHHSHKQNMFS